MSSELSLEEIGRYSRHLLLKEVGLEGQQKLKNAKVLIVGTGGLGAPLALYLASAGIGTIGLVDFDVVEESNLQRQVIHSTRDIDRPKVASAKDRIKGINPFITVNTYNTRITSENALEIIQNYDIVADGTDNFPTRYLLNDAGALLGKPIVYGSIFQFDGQVSVFHAKEGPCYRCLYPEPPPVGLVPNCAEGGVLGVLPGIVGSMQASEVIKLIVGANKEDTLIGRLLFVDAWRVKFRELKIDKDPSCPICSSKATITKLIDYEEFCGLGEYNVAANEIEQIAPQELKARIDNGYKQQIVDIRETHELAIAKFPNAITIPIGQLTRRINELDESIDAVFVCKVGSRSQFAIETLKNAGYKGRLINLEGGLNAWAQKIDPSIPIY
ncbi:MAG: molybdopterin-synthase adenylyltransferase MoeB [Helicobacteraceae bacterium]|jgi:adenylyltransferase/sulfurtransferase|nr:molybdopterin-synthase adenylyltransferase MoeB [Helicobacteraceae bacterium]